MKTPRSRIQSVVFSPPLPPSHLPATAPLLTSRTTHTLLPTKERLAQHCGVFNEQQNDPTLEQWPRSRIFGALRCSHATDTVQNI